MRKTILTITGPTASGKTTFGSELERTGRYKYIQTISTRARRDDSDTEYDYVSEEEFEEMVEKGELAQYIKFQDVHYYGTTWDTITDITNDNKIPFAIVDPQGVEDYAKVARTLGMGHVKLWINGDYLLCHKRLLDRYKDSHVDIDRVLALPDECKEWYKLQKWNYMIKEMTNRTRMYHVNKLVRCFSMLSKEPGMRIWSSI